MGSIEIKDAFTRLKQAECGINFHQEQH